MTLPSGETTRSDATPLPVVAVGGAAKILGVSTTHVRYLDRTGKLPAIRLENGQRIFVREQCEALAAARAVRKATAPGRRA